MSRHSFKDSTESTLTVFVGWDRPIGSYFAQIKGDSIDVARQVKMQKFRDMGFGANLGQIFPDLAVIERELKIVGIEIPPEIKEKLLADKSPDSHPNRVGRPLFEAVLAEHRKIN